MAVYKVIQDVEAEDKILGPLTLKSFIYAAIAGVLVFVDFRILVAGGPAIIRFAIAFVFLLPMALFATLASPLGRDQPTEVWLLSHIRFLLKPRERIWDQFGISQLVTITAPKRDTRQLTNGLSQPEVESRLQALASTLDSRGWVVKNSTVSLGGQAGYLDGEGGDSDRLVGASSLPQPVSVVDIHPADDIMDEASNATAQHFTQLMQQADTQRKQGILEKLEAAKQSISGSAPAQDTRFLDTASGSTGSTRLVGRQVIAPNSTDISVSDYDINGEKQLIAEGEALINAKRKRDEEIHRRSAGFKPKNEPQPVAAKTPVTAANTAVKLELAQSGNDLSVASIAHLANRTGRVQQLSPGEVVISLH